MTGIVKRSPYDPGGVGQVEIRKPDGTYHHTTFNTGTNQRFSHNYDPKTGQASGQHMTNQGLGKGNLFRHK